MHACVIGWAIVWHCHSVDGEQSRHIGAENMIFTVTGEWKCMTLREVKLISLTVLSNFMPGIFKESALRFECDYFSSVSLWLIKVFVKTWSLMPFDVRVQKREEIEGN